MHQKYWIRLLKADEKILVLKLINIESDDDFCYDLHQFVLLNRFIKRLQYRTRESLFSRNNAFINFSKPLNS
ncbi:hypothetical protein BpHYR1_013662 [Brachionus plicatilis]|uniref:Uncharacterized protein n=1 Tax=Brachionus plicatilis TaxID=10195 RepID=A0A3M7SXA4_BRAPC|nr:hypothetical protein BpHYR1_013662 [Brachionus plicatilis]